MPNSFFKFLNKTVALMFMLTTLSAINAMAYNCQPVGEEYDKDVEMGLTLCEGGQETNYTLSGIRNSDITWPSDWQLSFTKEFQIRSCGDAQCNNPTRFTLFNRTEQNIDPTYAVTLKDDTGNSKIPLHVSVTQHNGASIELPNSKNCKDGGHCPFTGAGKGTPLPDKHMTLSFSADLETLLNNRTLNQPGTHSGTLRFSINQAASSSNEGSGDSGHTQDVDLFISLLVPNLLQISGLNDINISSSNLVNGFYTGSDEFCVFRLGGGKFDITARGTNIGDDDRFILTNSGQNPARYFLSIYDKNLNNPPRRFRRHGQTKDRDSWLGNCPPILGNNNHQQTNMKVDVMINPAQVNEAGVYTDTMTLTVSPFP